MKWEAKIIKHRGESRIAVLFEKDPPLPRESFRVVTGYKNRATENCNKE